MKTGYKVVKVSKDAITMQNPATGDISVPYGMAVWSTGIGTRPFVVEFMKQIGQVDIKSKCSFSILLQLSKPSEHLSAYTGQSACLSY